jgi:hypothetical protein
MYHSRTLPASERRRAVILMVVLVLLTLFAIVGLAFVLYANAEGEASRVYRETTIDNNGTINISANSLASFAFGQLLFDTADSQVAGPLGPGNYPTGPWSAMRGHSVGRDMYGWDGDSPGSNIYPFNGPGHLHGTGTTPFANAPFNAPYDDHALISYIPWYTTPTYASERFVRDPERLSYRPVPGGPPPPPDPMMAAPSTNPYGGGWNSSYTYPDGNHVFLGAVDGGGYVLARSFWRPYLIPTNPNAAAGPGQGKQYLPLDPNHPNFWSWSNNVNPGNPADVIPQNLQTILKYTSLRPRNSDMDPSFPLPGLGGDVSNLAGYPVGYPGSNGGANDSVWIDLDYPVQVAPNGTKFKPLFAFFIMDLDGRVNLNVVGNVRGRQAQNPPFFHVSNQGWGPWEINPGQLSPQGNAQAQGEWPQLFLGSAQANQPGRYSPAQIPLSPLTNNMASGSYFPHIYAQADYDGSDDSISFMPPYLAPTGVGGQATKAITLPSPGTAFPQFPPGYTNTVAQGANPPAERFQHPLLYDSQYPTSGANQRFTTDNLTSLLNGGPNSTTATVSNLGQVLPNNLGTFRVRNLMTTDSAAVERPGLTPWLWDRTNATSSTSYGYGGAGQTNAHFAPGYGLTFSWTYALAARQGMVPANSEFRIPGQNGLGVDWRSFDAALGKVDLNRFLSPYPHQGQGTTPASYSPTPMNANTNGPPSPLGPNDPYVGQQNSQAIMGQAAQAQTDRQKLANDIYRRLLRVAGVPDPQNKANPTAVELAPRRWLAQLAVNIVDFIDEDEISTPFNFYTTEDNGGQPLANPATFQNTGNLTGPPAVPATVSPTSPSGYELLAYWVFGTELPRVVINEVLAEYVTAGTSKTDFPVNVFVELHNPLPTPGQAGGNPNAVQPIDNAGVPLYVPLPGGGGGYSPYVLVVTDTNGTQGTGGLLTAPNILPGTNPAAGNDNPLGTPNWIRTLTDFTNGPTGGALQLITNPAPQPQPPQAAVIPPQQFLLVGNGVGLDAHKTIALKGSNPQAVVPNNTLMLTTQNMTYAVQQVTAPTSQWIFSGPQFPAKAPATWANFYSTAGYPGLDQNLAPAGSTTNDGPNTLKVPTGSVTGISVLLRRVLNPHMPYDPNPSSQTWNPFVTVDSMKSFTDPSGQKPAIMLANDATNNNGAWTSIAKQEPYASNTNNYFPQPAGGPSTTVDTFGSINQTVAPFNWLTHLDRQLISPMELLQVSGFQPHELTQRFLQGGNAPGHYASWYDENNRLYRAFEFFTTHNRAAGVSFAGRQPGMININTIYDPEPFMALADPQAGNGFGAVLGQVYPQMLQMRSPGMNVNVQPGQRVVTGQDRPFLGFGIGRMPNNPGSTPANPGDPISVSDDASTKASNTGIEDTFLRSFAGGPSNPNNRRLFEVTGAPTTSQNYQNTELMRKMFGNITTRSNVFAVWVTVGFFQVAPGGDLVRPVKLGAEIGAAQGNNIRHQFFAVIDRTRMMIDPYQITMLNNAIPSGPPFNIQLNQPAWVSIASNFSANSPNTNIPYNIQPGSILTVDNGNGSEETIVVQTTSASVPLPPGVPNPPGGGGNWIYTTFTKPHGPGALLNINGNPGPQTSFSITSATGPSPPYPNMVLTYSVLK